MKPTPRLRTALVRLFWLPGYLLDLPPEHPHRFHAAQVILYVGLGIILVAAILNAGALPPHAIAVDRYGTWTCERGYLMRARDGRFECVAEEEAARESAAIVSDLPSAGEGARRARGEGRGQGPVTGAAPARPAAQAGGLPKPLFIQTDRPWTVVLDAQGNPSTVIIGGARSRPAPSALFGR